MSKKKASAFSTLGLIGVLLFGAGYKRYQESSMPVNFPLNECQQRIESASDLELREIPFSFGNSYNIVVGGEKVGTVDEKVINFGKRFDFYAGNVEEGVHLGYAEAKVFSFDYQVDVFNSAGEKIGRLDEILMSYNPGSLIDIYDNNNKKVATSDQLFAFRYKTSIYDPSEREIGKTRKATFWDDFKVHIDDKQIDRRLILALIAVEDKIYDGKRRKSSNN